MKREKNYSLSEARKIMEQYNKKFGTSYTTGPFVVGEALDELIEAMITDLD